MALYTTDARWSLSACGSLHERYAHFSRNRTVYSSEGALVACCKRSHYRNLPSIPKSRGAVTFFRVRSAGCARQTTPLTGATRVWPFEPTRLVETCKACVKSQAKSFSGTLKRLRVLTELNSPWKVTVAQSNYMCRSRLKVVYHMLATGCLMADVASTAYRANGARIMALHTNCLGMSMLMFPRDTRVSLVPDGGCAEPRP